MITIIDYGLGNIGSVANTLERLDQTYAISADPKEIASAGALILPGVGAAGAGMQNLQDRGLDVAIRQAISNNTPFFGICLGMQLLFDYSEEGNTDCLGIISGTVKKYAIEKRIPQIGWNTVRSSSSLFEGISPDSFFYFVNSYYCIPVDTSIVIGESTYGETFASVIQKDTIMATQFHPEKSGKDGFRLLQNFIKEYNI